MNAKRFVLLPAFVVTVSIAGVAPDLGAAAAGASHANICAPPAV
jgi:hypothetical protein